MAARLTVALGLIVTILKKERDAYAAALGLALLGIAALRPEAKAATVAMSVFVLRFLPKILISLLILFPLSPQTKSPSGDPIFESFGMLSFAKLGNGVLQVWAWFHCDTEIKDSATTDYYHSMSSIP
jgi:hypothetical protein